MKPLIIDVLCGGQSEEHPVSVLSAVSIVNGLLDLSHKYQVFPVYISKKGRWHRPPKPLRIPCDPSILTGLVKTGIPVSPSLDPQQKVYFSPRGKFRLPDIFFPVLHGTKGEDGTIQGLFEMMRIPFVGSSVTGGACGMDKDVMRSILKANRFPLLNWITIRLTDWKKEPRKIKQEIERKLKYPLFVKPACLGSSVGISKVKNHKELEKGIRKAFLHGTKILIEQGKEVRELECSLLGNNPVTASRVGEIIPGSEFYDYQDKYHSNRSKLEIPARISKKTEIKIQELARKAFICLNAQGLSRMDFFLCKKTKKLFVNEINTFPGFTKISMYPKLWEFSGIGFGKLLERLIELGFERDRENSLEFK